MAMREPATSVARREMRLAVIAGEHSGDALGGPLLAALRQQADAFDWRFAGVGGEAMAEQGLRSVFPLSDVAVMGPLAILARLPHLLKRIREAADVVIAAQPHGLVIIDSPEFTHAVARRVRKVMPDLPVIDYVSPSVWAWRPGRAKRMTAYVDHILAILPFEPVAHRNLGGPDCTYVGHPLTERLNDFTPDLHLREESPPTLLVLPGSRVTEVRRLMKPFGETLELLQRRIGPFEAVLPAPDSVRSLVEDLSRNWTVTPQIVSGSEAKHAAFRRARAALAASGTVTLELALARVPMAVAYRIDPVASALRFLLKAHSVVLPNLILGRNAIPEFIQERCRPDLLAAAIEPLIRHSEMREAQMNAFEQVVQHMLAAGSSPSERAAAVVMEVLSRSDYLRREIGT